MTPVGLLVGFCTLLSIIAIVQLLTDEQRDLVDIGTTAIVVAITLAVVVWQSIQTSWLPLVGQVLVGLAALVLFAAGTILATQRANWAVEVVSTLYAKLSPTSEENRGRNRS
ncbi:hypothetical protein ACLI4Z_03630 [Natrialbaceae archaeon A-arb3/5]